MAQVTVIRWIQAPVGKVFQTVADIHEFSQAIPEIVKVEMLAGDKPAIGTRFRETRRMKDKKITTELEVTEYIEGNRVRMVADSHGTVWDTVFTVQPENGQTKLTVVMDARPHKLLPKLITPLILPMVKKSIEQNMDSVKVFCERYAPQKTP